MPPRSKTDQTLLLIIVAIMAWVVPGAGHLIIKEKKRALIVFLTVSLTFLTGILIGSIGVIDAVNARIWYLAQSLTSPIVIFLAKITASGDYLVYGKPNEIGQIYTTVAGLLNLLCVFSAVYMAYSGRGEMIGEEEDNG